MNLPKQALEVAVDEENSADNFQFIHDGNFCEEEIVFGIENDCNLDELRRQAEEMFYSEFSDIEEEPTNEDEEAKTSNNDEMQTFRKRKYNDDLPSCSSSTSEVNEEFVLIFKILYHQMYIVTEAERDQFR